MSPKVIIHNVVSLDGCLTGFEPKLDTYYKIAGSHESDAVLVGSNTAKTGIEIFMEKIPLEEESDFIKPEIKSNDPTPFWVIPDSRGVLLNLLHVFRRFKYCKDLIVLISKKTPEHYIKYLKERNYDYHVVGDDHVDLNVSLEILSERYQVRKVLVDAGRILGNLLLERGLVSEISLLVHPIIVGKGSYNIFGNIDKTISLELQKKETFDDENIWLVYKVKPTSIRSINNPTLE